MEKQLKDYMGNVDEIIALFKQKVERIENERAALQARCDRYEKALKAIRDFYPSSNIQPDKVANEALNGEGENWWQELSIENMPQYVKITGVGCSIIQHSIVKVEGAGVFDDPMFDNMGEPYVLLRDKHFEVRGLTRMNCKNCEPATAEEYASYINQQH